jgi:hypothetical protein
VRIIPRNQPDGSAVDLLETMVDLCPPGFFHADIYFGVQALEQRIGQSGAGFGRE